MNSPVIPPLAGDRYGTPALAGSGRLRLQVTTDHTGQPRIRVGPSLPSLPSVKKVRSGKPWKLIRRGSVTIKVYRSHPPKNPTIQPSTNPVYTVAWRDSATGHRQRAMRSDPALAIAFAEEKATSLANGETWKQSMGANDYASYLRARELIAPCGKSLELVCSEYMEQWAKRPAGVTQKNIPDLVTHLLETKATEKKGKRWVTTLKQQLDRFAEKFQGPLDSVAAHEINAWLRGLHGRARPRAEIKPIGLRTRANYRAAIHELVRFAQAENCLDKNWPVLKSVDDPEVPPVEVRTYSPEEAVRLLAHARPNVIPFLAILLFAGVRHQEMSAEDKSLLDWSDIDLKNSTIRIDKRVGKTKKLRIIKIQPNLAAWLAPYARRSGPICELGHTANALVRLGRRAGVPWIKNAPRKTFISHRVALDGDVARTAYEAGNSAQIIKDNYLELVTQDQAAHYFGIFPVSEKEILQLRFF